MTFKHVSLIGLMLSSSFLISCTTYRPAVINPEFEPIDLNSKVQAGFLRQQVDNFYVIQDASGSQDQTYRGHTKFAIALDFLHRFNQTIPRVPLNSALRGFGQSRRPFTEQTKLYYGPTAYTQDGFRAGVDQIAWGGAGSPVDLALDSAAADMTAWRGRTALILVGDGDYGRYDPVSAVNRLKAQYGDNLCLYTVLVGAEDPASVNSMKEIAEAGACGFYQSVKYLASRQAMAAWVEAVLFEKDRIRTTAFDKALPLATNQTEWGSRTQSQGRAQGAALGPVTVQSDSVPAIHNLGSTNNRVYTDRN